MIVLNTLLNPCYHLKVSISHTVGSGPRWDAVYFCTRGIFDPRSVESLTH